MASSNGALFERITRALINNGYTTLDEQARALGLPRSTAWTIVKSKHKLGRLSVKVRERMLAHADLPLQVRLELEGRHGAIPVGAVEASATQVGIALTHAEEHAA